MGWKAVKEFLRLNKLKFCVFLTFLLIFISLSSTFIIDQLTGTTILNEYHALECGFCIRHGTADKIKDCYNSIPVSPWGIVVGGTKSGFISYKILSILYPRANEIVTSIMDCSKSSWSKYHYLSSSCNKLLYEIPIALAYFYILSSIIVFCITRVTKRK